MTITRLLALPVLSVGIFGGAFLGLAGIANADTGTDVVTSTVVVSSTDTGTDSSTAADSATANDSDNSTAATDAGSDDSQFVSPVNSGSDGSYVINSYQAVLGDVASPAPNWVPWASTL